MSDGPCKVCRFEFIAQPAAQAELSRRVGHFTSIALAGRTAAEAPFFVHGSIGNVERGQFSVTCTVDRQRDVASARECEQMLRMVVVETLRAKGILAETPEPADYAP